MRTTHTYAILEVSAEAYAEIRALLEAAEYQHAFHDDVVDMHGIAVKARARTENPALTDVVDAWIDLPSPGMVPNGYGDAVKRLVDAVDRLIGGTELLEDPNVQRRTAIATAKARIVWATKQMELAQHHNLTAEVVRYQRELADAREQALKLGVGS